MPNESNSAELFARLRAVEQAISNHASECNIRNENLREWMAHSTARDKEHESDIQTLKMDRAKMAGAFLLLGTLSSAIGAGGVLALFKTLGGP